ncbi:MAG TPA: hypothetical protein PKD09_18620 [Aggregatilinea sp.]|uniref:hypothetical protein n=1 Tax=Aggregatilinea sp. TaxID=2806333 RepID=UPI002B90A788|nr:hypothetical protein [Aggregatilinea sp.]HML23677.1 hypothetical protein [Aggregatilinea sp.]
MLQRVLTILGAILIIVGLFVPAINNITLSDLTPDNDIPFEGIGLTLLVLMLIVIVLALFDNIEQIRIVMVIVMWSLLLLFYSYYRLSHNNDSYQLQWAWLLLLAGSIIVLLSSQMQHYLRRPLDEEPDEIGDPDPEADGAESPHVTLSGEDPEADEPASDAPDLAAPVPMPASAWPVWAGVLGILVLLVSLIAPAMRIDDTTYLYIDLAQGTLIYVLLVGLLLVLLGYTEALWLVGTAALVGIGNDLRLVHYLGDEGDLTLLWGWIPLFVGGLLLLSTGWDTTFTHKMRHAWAGVNPFAPAYDYDDEDEEALDEIEDTEDAGIDVEDDTP